MFYTFMVNIIRLLFKSEHFSGFSKVMSIKETLYSFDQDLLAQYIIHKPVVISAYFTEQGHEFLSSEGDF